MNRYYSPYPETKTKSAGKGASTGRGSQKNGGHANGPKHKGITSSVKERTADWPSAGPAWKSSFNRKTKFVVAKTRPAKEGID